MTTLVNKRSLTVSKPAPPGSVAVSQLSTLELRNELERRIRSMQQQRLELLEKVAQIDQQLTALGVRLEATAGAPSPGGRSDASGRPRTRPKNSASLSDVLASVLNGGAMTTNELADAALQVGFQTTSKNFAATVNTALYRDDRFVKRERKWRLVTAEEGDDASVDVDADGEDADE